MLYKTQTRFVPLCMKAGTSAEKARELAEARPGEPE